MLEPTRFIFISNGELQQAISSRTLTRKTSVDAWTLNVLNLVTIDSDVLSWSIDCSRLLGRVTRCNFAQSSRLLELSSRCISSKNSS